jgi:uncharacterized membrane protein YdjX (TVP38/TMEM64 family)
MRRVVPLAVLLLLAGLVAAGGTLRSRVGLELSPESVRTWVLGLGLTAQLVFVGLVVFRNFLLLPSMVVLTAGGLAFGSALGTLLGAAGILLSGLMTFGLARAVGREWLRSHVGETFRRFERRLERTGPFVIGLTTAHPMGPMSPFHWAAGLSSIAWLPFALAIGLAGLVRAFAYASFGSTLLEAGSAGFYRATAFLLAVALLPLAHRGVRERVFGPRRQ